VSEDFQQRLRKLLEQVSGRGGLRCAQCWVPELSRNIPNQLPYQQQEVQLVTVNAPQMTVNMDPTLEPFLESCASLTMLAGKGPSAPLPLLQSATRWPFAAALRR
jgi:hypothetical protein